MLPVQTSRNEALLETLRTKIGSEIKSASLNLGDVEIVVEAHKLLGFCKILKLDAELAFNLFLSVTAVDWMDQRENRFEVVYHLLSTSRNVRVRIKVDLSEAQPEIDSLSELWPGANFMEREVWDMYGIKFKGHPDLRRILMYDEFVGHPLRKDYPLRAKQPRMPLRHPEVTNTARDMKRPALVSINKRRPPQPEQQN